jgi:hypothetical protein
VSLEQASLSGGVESLDIGPQVTRDVSIASRIEGAFYYRRGRVLGISEFGSKDGRRDGCAMRQSR